MSDVACWCCFVWFHFAAYAYVEESFYLGDNNLDLLISIKSKKELIADIIAALESPAKNVIGALQSGGNTLSGVLKTLSEKAE